MSSPLPGRANETVTGRRLVIDPDVLIWLALVVVALVLRLYDLGARVMSHDESIHAFYGYELLRRGGYTHDPVYHGPLLYHLNALMFFLFGASDATARLSSALAGTALVGSLWLYRPLLGRTGALFSAVLVALSPALLFYSRQVWMDVHVALFTMLWIYGIVRYLADRRRRWLYLVTGAMTLAFAAKEVAFIFGAIAGAWLVIELVATRRRDPPRAAAAGDLAVLMLALVLPFTSGALYLALGWSVRDTRAAGFGVMAGLVAVAGAAVVAWRVLRRGLVAGPRTAGSRSDAAIAGGTAGVDALTPPLSPAHAPSPAPAPIPAPPAPTTAAAGVRLRDWAALMILFWGTAILLFTTLFTKIRTGIVSGVVGSLGYWLTQHEVARGSQPWFYYLLLSVLYEPLLLVAGTVSLVIAAARLRRPAWDPAAGDLAPATGLTVAADGAGTLDRSQRRGFFSLLSWWAIASWGAYTFAGEKMPWLVTHMALPLALLAGWGLARLVLQVRWHPRAAALVLGGGGLIAPVLVAKWLAAPALAGPTTAAVADTMQWIVRGTAIVALVAFMTRAALRTGAGQALRLVALGVAGLLFVLGVRAGIRLCYVNYDLATEHLSYAQGSPDVKRAMREIQLISERSAGDRDLFVAYDDQSSWPFVWYLRDYRKSRTWGTQPNFAQGAAVILTGPKNRDAIWPQVSSGYVKRDYRLIWWPRQDYSSMGVRDLLQLLRDPERRGRLWRMALHHDYSHLDFVKWDPRQEFDMYVREDVAPLGIAAVGISGGLSGSATAGAGPGSSNRIEPAPLSMLTGPYGERQLAAPTDVAVAADGAVVIADAGNHRIVVLEPDGAVRTVFGSRCDLGSGAGCVDPDGTGPLASGDGQFNEPWGVALGRGGEIYVADTWNHRVQRFDARGRFLGKWGRFGNNPGIGANQQGEEPVFYGPRGIHLWHDDELLVSDTGNKRIVLFDTGGAFRRALGSAGIGLAQWNEPVGLAIDAGNDTLVVADTWNHRIQRLDRRYAALAAWRVPDWQSENVTDKPFLTVDDAGTVYAGDPAGGRVWLFEPGGRLAATLALPAPASGRARPLGLAVDGDRRQLLVVDQAGSRVLVFALPAIESSRTRS